MQFKSAAITMVGTLLVSGLALGSYQELADWNSLPRLKTNVTAGLASSYDRAGGNLDFSQYDNASGVQIGEGWMMVKTLVGPGEITRFWMPHYTVDQNFALRIFLDNETTPRFDTTSNAFFFGTYAFFGGPLRTTAAGGCVSFDPIPFLHSARIEAWNKTLPATGGFSANRNYYQYSYHLFAADGPDTSYTGTLSPEQQTERGQVNAILQNLGANPAGSDPQSQTISTGETQVLPGTTLTLARVTGPGAIRKLTIRMDGATDADLEGLRLRVRYDDSGSYAIDVPVAHFFAAGFGRTLYKSLPLGTDSPDGFYCYWPMPFRRAISVEVFNSTAGSIAIAGAAVEYMLRPVTPDEGYFHAAFATEQTTNRQADHCLANITGKGHYVGNLLWLAKAASAPSTVLEGDDLITADNTTLYGTGLEDAYCGGYYYNWVGVRSNEPEGSRPHHAIRPYHGLLKMDPVLDNASKFTGFYRVDQYRWHIPDYVPFTQSLNVRVENYGGVGGITYGSTAFYYLDDPLPGDANLDGQVGFQDFAILQNHYGQTGRWPDGDFNGDGRITFEDFSVLQNHYGQAAATEDVSAGMTAAASAGMSCPLLGLLLLVPVGLGLRSSRP